MSAERFYLVDEKSDTHRVITEMYAKRKAATDARFAMMHKLFPQSKPKKAGWGIVSYNSFGVSRLWSIQPPNGVEMPADWKRWSKESLDWVPRTSTKAGKKLHREMQSAELCVPGAAQFAEAIGIKTTFVNMQLQSASFYCTSDGRYIVGIQQEQNIPSGVTRISDIEKEKLCEPKKATAKKPAKKRKAAAK